jgi:hypothetical protein
MSKEPNDQSTNGATKAYEVKFQYILQPTAEGPYPAIIGLGSDGILWVESDAFGVPPDELEKMAKTPGPTPRVLLDGTTRRVFVNARAVAEMIEEVQVRAKMYAGIKVIIEEMQRSLGQKENVQNN